MKLSDTLKAQRAVHVDAMEALNKAAGPEANGGTARVFTDAETQAWNTAKAAVATLDTQIAQAIEREELTRNAAPAVHTGRTLAPGEVRAFTNKERMFGEPGGERPSLGTMVRAIATGDWSRASVERAALGETPPSSGQFLVPGAMWGTIIDKARNASVMVQAGALSIPMDTSTLTVAKLLTDPTASFRNESQAITESEPTFGPLVFTARSLGCLVRVSNELLADAVDGGASIENAMAAAVALAMDGAGLNGDGVAPNPLGILQTPGIGVYSMGADGAAPTSYAPWINAMGLVRSANEVPAAAIMSARTQTDLDLLTNTLGDPMTQPPAYAALNKLVTNAIPDTQGQGNSGAVCSSSIVGDFTKCAFGIRQSAMMEVTNTGGTGTFAQVETLIRVVARMDFHALRPAAFAKIIGIKDTP